MRRIVVSVLLGILLCSVGGPVGAHAVDAVQTDSEIHVTGGSLSNSSVTTGENIGIRVNVENIGDTSGSVTVSVTANGQQVASRSVTLDADDTRTVTFSQSFSTVGTRTIRANGVRIGSVEVTTGGGRPSVDVIETPSGVTVNIGEGRIGQLVDINLGNTVSQSGTGLAELSIELGDSTGGFRVEVSPTQRGPPAGVPAVDTARDGATAFSYFTAAPAGSDVPVFNGVTYEFSVATADLPEGVTAQDVVLLRYNEEEGNWDTLPTTYLGNEEYEAQSPGFSAYAIGIAEPQASFTVGETSISTRELEVGEETTVEATITNEGNARGTFTANLTVDGEVRDTRSVTLGPDESETVEFTISFDEMGTYDIGINGQSVAAVDVVESQQTPDNTAAPVTPAPVTTPSGPLAALRTGGGPPWEAVVVGVGLLFSLAVAWYVRRRDSELPGAGTAVPTDTDPDDRLEAVEEMVADAEASRADGEFSEAIDAYNEALDTYESVRDDLPANDDRLEEIAATISTIRAQRRETVDLQSTAAAVREALTAAERQLLEAIVAHVEGESVLARTRYRNARDRFREARDLAEDADDDGIVAAERVVPDPAVTIADLPESVADLPSVSEAATDCLREAGFTTTADLASGGEEARAVLRSEPEVDADAALTAITWWRDPDEERAWTTTRIDRRIERADRGRSACL